MNKLVRGLLSGASLATLQLCAVGAARASAPLVINAATGAVTVTAGQSPDYIQVTNTGDITGDLTNEGSVNVGVGNSTGIEVQGVISGSLVNAASGVIGGTAHGIYVHGASASIGVKIGNSGKILVSNVSDTNGNVFANAIQFESTGVNKVTNSGTIGVDVEVIGSSTDNAEAAAAGVFEYANASNANNIVQRFVQTGGALALTAIARATSAGDSVEASAVAESAVKQGGFNSARIDQGVTNSGDVSMSATVKGVSVSDEAEVEARAVKAFFQDASNNASHAAGALIKQAVTNSGSLSMSAVARAIGSDFASASAQAKFAFDQYAQNAQTISQAVTNSGAVSLFARARATSLSSEAYDVTAYAGDVFDQQAYGNFSHAVGAADTQSISNSGSVVVSAAATANAVEYASAQATVEDMFFQRANNAQSMSQSIHNTGDVSLAASAKAVSLTSEVEDVSAFAGDVFSQSATNNSVLADSGVTQSITNSGSVHLAATATAQAKDYASASASAEYVFYQYARNAITVSQSLANTGNLDLSANVKATSTASEIEDVQAFVGYVAEQYAYISGAPAAGASIAQSITNSGSVTLIATAAGKAQDYASVSATAEYGFKQGAYNVPTISQTISNTGALSFSAAAKVTSTASEASAEAFAGVAFSQRADGDGTAGSKITQGVTNSGALILAAAATAKASRTATADARVDNAIYQDGNDVQTLVQTITNSGALSLSANARAIAQFATDDSANAKAFASDILSQYADDVGSVTQTISNSGALTVGLHAVAKNGAFTSNDSARAGADASRLMVQQAHGTGSSNVGTEAVLAITNSATVSIAEVAAAGGGDTANAQVTAAKIMGQTAKQFVEASESLHNSGSILIQQTASASGGAVESVADTYVDDILHQYYEQNSLPGSSASLTAVNSGAIAVGQSAHAVNSVTRAYAYAAVYDVFSQEAQEVESAALSLTNSGSIAINNTAQASGVAVGQAGANGYISYQRADNVLTASIAAANTGNVILGASANAIATAFASAKGNVYGFEQRVFLDQSSEETGSAILSVHNSGTLDLAVTGTATGGLRDVVNLRAFAVSQEFQNVGGTAVVKNSGVISVAAVATALPGKLGEGVTLTTTRLPYASALAVGVSVSAQGKTGVFHDNSSAQTFTAGAPLQLAISNSGTLRVSAVANGLALDAANIAATAMGVAVSAKSEIARTRTEFNASSIQHTASHGVSTGGHVGGTISNNGSLAVSASAEGGVAVASGVTIVAEGIAASVTNASNGRIVVGASGATAAAVGIGEANLTSTFDYHRSYGHLHTGSHTYGQVSHRTYVSGISPAVSVSGDITNSGTIRVSAIGNGDNIGDGRGGGGFAALPLNAIVTSNVKARAEGIVVNAESMSGDVLNAGTIDVSASGPNAIANGIHLLAERSGTTFKSTETYRYRTSISGYGWTYVSNTQAFHTLATDNTVTGKVSNSGTVSVTAAGAGAKAKGIYIQAGTLDDAVLNSGTIEVTATGSTSATGIELDVANLGDDAALQNNGGTIIARYNDGGVYVRGTAIDVSAAPGTLVIGLNGGYIFGNIVENVAGNAVTVGSGNLLLDGIINPSHNKIGSLTVAADATLTLDNNAREGGGSAYVDTFKQNGTLTIVAGPDGSAGSIHAASATINGAALVDPQLSGAAFDTSTTYKVVFSDADLSGTWSSVGASHATTFFSASGVYSDHEADITLTRATFDSIEGLTSNEASVAAAIESIYETSGLTGPLGGLLGALFNLTPEQFADALEALSGIPAAQLSAADQATAQSFLDAINSHLGDTSGGTGGVASLMSGSSALASNTAPSDVAPAQMSDLSGTRVWGGGFQSGSSVDRTASGPAYSSHQSGLLAGVDMPVNQNFLVGVAASYSTGDIATERMLGFGTFTARQVAGYLRFVADSGIYALGSVSYGDFTNKLTRYIAIPGFGPGNVRGQFDSTAWGLYGEAGWKFNPSDWASSITPYAAISYLDADSDGFTEKGTFGAPLVIGSSSSKATSSYLGVKLSTSWEWNHALVTPRLTAAWQHDFTKNAWEMNAAFAAVPTVGFGLNGSDLSRDGAYIDGGITLGLADSVDVLLDYQGRFTSDRSDNSIMARASFKFW